MDLTPYVDHLRNELAVAAEAGGDEARALAERLTAPLESAVRLTLLNVLSTAMGEVTHDLAPGSVDVRLRGLDPEFVVTPAPSQAPLGAADGYEDPAYDAVRSPPAAPAPGPVPDGDEVTGTDAMGRINFRLPTHLKARVEEAAGQEGLSVNAWLQRAVAGALESGRTQPRPTRGRAGGQGYTGWVR